MGRVRLKNLGTGDTYHIFPSGRRYYFKGGVFATVADEDFEWAKRFPNRYDVEGVKDKAKSVVDKVKEKIVPKKESPNPEGTGASGRSSYSKETLFDLNKDEQEKIIKSYGEYDVPRYEAGRVALILALQDATEPLEGDELDRVYGIRKKSELDGE